MIITLNVEGMSCAHCENAVKSAVGALGGIEYIAVDLAAKTVAVDYHENEVTEAAIKAVIEEQGYDVE